MGAAHYVHCWDTGGAFGGWLGVKMAIARLEFWKDLTDGKIKELTRNTDLHHDDIMTLDFEVGQVLQSLKLPRVMRQRIRD